MKETNPIEDPDAIIIDDSLLDLPTTPAPQPHPLKNGMPRISAKTLRKQTIAERKRKRTNKPPRYNNYSR